MTTHEAKQYRYLDMAGNDKLFDSHREAFAWACASTETQKGVYLVCHDGKLAGINVWLDGQKSDWYLQQKHSYQFRVV